MTNDDVIKGKIKQVEGKAQDALGDVTNTPENNVKGNLKQAEGKVQEGFGKVKEAVKDALNADK